MGAMSTGKAAAQGEHRSGKTDRSKKHSFPFQWVVEFCLEDSFENQRDTTINIHSSIPVSDVKHHCCQQ